MLGKPISSFKEQRAALAQTAQAASVDNTFGQSMQAAQSLLKQAAAAGPAGFDDAGNGVTKEALEALWSGRNGNLQGQIGDIRSQIDGLNGSENATLGPAPQLTDKREAEVFNAYVNAGFDPKMARAIVINGIDESQLAPSVVEAAPNVHGTRGQGILQLTDIKPGVGRRSDYFNWMKNSGRNDYWSDDSQARFSFWESQNTEKHNYAKLAGINSIGELAAAYAEKIQRPAKTHLNTRMAKYRKLGY